MLGLILKSISHFIRDINNGTGPLAKPKNFPLKLLTSMQSAHPDFIDLESFNSIQPNKIHIDFREGCNFYKEKKNQELYLYEEDFGFSFESTTIHFVKHTDDLAASYTSISCGDSVLVILHFLSP